MTVLRWICAVSAAAASVWLIDLARGDPAAPNRVASAGASAAVPVAAAKPVDFNHDVRPILSDTCFKCHGFDEKERKAGLRLDRQEDALKTLESGERAIVPGKLDESELIRRITSDDPDVRMPPKSGKQLSAQQIDTLKRWVGQGAKYAQHWSFAPPHRPELPAIADSSRTRSAIDYFILDRLAREGLPASAEAPRSTLIRRASLDLTGLPPLPQEVDAFAADASPDAYERVVDRLLASPRFGERMAVDWLDASRYADTHGYHIDSQRDMWRWREWVIDAFNQDKPFDAFTIEQLAGDLLPNATLDQKLASGFQRNHMINFEGGAIPEEYLSAYIVDRVNTLGMVWLGLTVNCTQCHDHKYDPLTQKEFYQLYAFFHNVPENGLDGQSGNAGPAIATPSAAQLQLTDTLTRQVAELDAKMKERETQIGPALAAWEAKQRAETAMTGGIPAGQVAHFAFDSVTSEGGKQRLRDSVLAERIGTIEGPATLQPGKFGQAIKLDGNAWVDVGDQLKLERTDAFSYGAWIYPTNNNHGAIVAKMDDAKAVRGYDLYWGGGQIFVHLIHRWEDNAIRVNTKSPLAVNQWHHVLATYDGSSKAEGVRVYVNGKPAELQITHNSLTETIGTPLPLHIGKRNPGAAFQGMIDDVRFFNRALNAAEAAQVAGADPIGPILAIAPDQRTAEQQRVLARHYLETADDEFKRLSAEIAEVRKRETELKKSIPTTMVMQELPKPRDTFMLIRGQYDKKGEKVTAGVPAILPPLPKDAPPNRLGLAKWLVDPSHPLVSRVVVNRYWQSYFGTGIVKTAEDFGSQGEWPSHPALIDWLAREFVDSGWQVKALQRTIVTSATYRQSSAVTPLLVAKDAENRLLARGPRVRLSAEFIRDQALAVSGLFAGQIGGQSVSPYHPAGLWEEMAFGGGFSAQSYKQSGGADLYRRTMYTFWKRTVPPASLSTFDAPDREVCSVRRLRTNTPLQALVLMNDPTYVEASRKLAERMMKEGGATAETRIRLAFRLAMSREPSVKELAVLGRLHEQQLARFKADGEAAKKLLAVGESKRDETLDAAELAAWTTVASVILNLDETITKG